VPSPERSGVGEAGNLADHSVLTASSLRVDLKDERAWIDDAAIKLGPKPFALLVALMRSPERLLTKDALIETVWDGRAVSDAVLTTAMRELRRALSDDARTPTFVETVHGRGYRFLLPVHTHAAEQLSEKSSKTKASTPLAGIRKRLLAIVPLVVIIAGGIWLNSHRTGPVGESIAAPKSLVVMPLRDLSPLSDQDWFAGGLTEELLSSLTRTPDLHVVSAFLPDQPDQARSSVDVANGHGVAHTLEGSVRRADGRVRVTAQLTRAVDGARVWSESYDRAETDVIGIQEEIAFAIAQSLRTVMDPDQLRRMVDAGTRSVEAYEAFLSGHHLLNRQYITGNAAFRRRAYEAYEDARAFDPTFSEAHWLAARYWLERSTYIIPPGEEARYSLTEISDRFVERVDAAIAAAPNEDVKLKFRAARHLHRLEHRTAHDLLRTYVKVRPNDPYAWVQLAETSSVIGDFETGRAAANRLDELSERNSLYLTRTVPVHLWVRDVEGSLVQARRALERAPGNAFVQYHAHRTLLWAEEFDAARELLPAIEAGALSEHNRTLSQLRQACADGDLDAADDLYDHLRSLSDASRASLWLAGILMGEHERANSDLLDLDSEEGLSQLVAWMRYQQFDSSSFPVLSRKLTAEGISLQTPLMPPYACHR